MGAKWGADAFNIMQYYNISSFPRMLILSTFATLCNIMQYFKNNILRLERPMGIEPTSTAWEAVVLPMNYGRKCLFIFYQLWLCL